MVDHADWGRADPFGAAAIPPYADSAALLRDLLAGADELIEGKPAGRLAQVLVRTAQLGPGSPPLTRGIAAWPLDRVALEILALGLAHELSPARHQQLGPALTPSLIARLLGRGRPADDALIEVSIALHPEGPLVELELIDHPPGAPWFERRVRATPAACELATCPPDPRDPLADVRLPSEPDERLVEIFVEQADAITVVRGRFEDVACAAAYTGARIVSGGDGRARSLAGALRDATAAGDAIPVLVTGELDERVRRMLGRSSGPRWVVIPSAEPLAVVTSSS